MSLHPLNELKRRLDNDTTPLPKRLRLAKNVVLSHHFATTPKERIVADWLEKLMKNNCLSSKDLKDVLSWLNNTDDLTSELKAELVKIVSQYLHNNPLQNEDIQYIVSFLENNKMSSHLSSQVDDFLFTTTALLQHVNNDIDYHLPIIEKIFNVVVKNYRESKKKLEFIIKLLHEENLETIFSYLKTPCHDSVIKLCQNILFPITKKSFFASFFSNLIRKDNIDELITEKGDNIQSVIKIMSVFFTFPTGRTGKDQRFLADFIDVFVSCYHTESQLIFAFYIMATSALNMPQSYMMPAMKIPPITFEENDSKVKRSLFLTMLEVLHKKEVDITVKLTDTLGEKIAKIEMKKNFTSFLQAVMMEQIKLEGKPDKVSLQILKTALALDPSLVEQKMQQILPHLITAKKNVNILSFYIDTINSLLEILFKLSRGMGFISQILPDVKLALEASNVEQFELKQKEAECQKNGEICTKLTSKILTGEDLFPQECVETYGKLTSELMFRQNKELLILLQRDLEDNCLMMLDEGFVSPSIITLAEVLSAILCSFFRHSKMADHTVPLYIAEDFWTVYQKFESECLKKFGECLLKLSYNSSLVLSFLKLCLSVVQLKLLNIKYSNRKLEIPFHSDQSEVYDLSLLLPCLDGKQWMNLATKVVGDEAVLILNNLLLAKTMALDLLASTNFDDNNLSITTIKSHLVKEMASKSNVDTNDYFTKVLFMNLDKFQYKQLAKLLVKSYLSDIESGVFQTPGIVNNKPLLQALVLETVRTMIKCFEDAGSLTKRLNKPEFNMPSFVNEVNIETYFKNITIIVENHEETITNCLEILKQLQIHYLEENYQLAAIFVLLAVKKCCQSKKTHRSIDYILQSLYELSPKYPDMYKLFPVEFIFSFEDNSVIDLLTLTIKTSNNLLVIKSILESAVKKVKTDSEIVKGIVQILLSKQKNNCSNISRIEYFSNPVFQISCLILPIIAKEKKAITTSAFRSILANLQEELNQAMLCSFKNIDFTNKTSLKPDDTDNIDDSMVIPNSTLAILNAMGAYTLTLLKCCETTDAEEIKNLDCLWSGLEFFVQNAIQSIANAKSKSQHVESSVNFLNVTLRYIKKLESHDVFKKKDEVLLQIWQSTKTRLLLVFDDSQKKKRLSIGCLEQIGITLKFLSELSSQESFAIFLGDLTTLSLLKKPSIILKNEQITKSQMTAHKVAKYLWTKCLRANIVGPKCIAMSKLMYRNCKNIKTWVYQHYDDVQNDGDYKMSVDEDGDKNVKMIKVDDAICELIRIDLDMLSEVILAAKKIPLDSKFLDAIFEVQHLVHYVMGLSSSDTRCEISWKAFFDLYEGCYSVLNCLLLSREELLEDRWPCYMQCFKPLVLSLCERATSQVQLERDLEEKLAEIAHSVEKLTQSICKRKTHVSRIAAYAVADLCSWLERTAPPKMVRKHLENSIALLIQASDSNYAMAFLKRALAGAAGQMTMTNMYTMYKRYHKYVGNA